VRFHQVIELAPDVGCGDVGHAGCLLDRPVFIEVVEAGVSIGLENSAEACKMTLRMLSLAIR
jgi:hypothetical protein